ncbi:MAG TPA: glutamate racemase [Spirochaetota bacterium]|nr:glutamate racemase [Spirochaetota bacterium]
MEREKAIAFFDSGIGGLTVLFEALQTLPEENYLYFADSKNAPYGIKSKEEVHNLVKKAVDFLLGKDIKALIIACNTATSVTIEDLRKSYSIPIIGMEPAVKPAVEKSEQNHKRVIVTATPLTLKEEKLKNLIERVDNEHIVDLLPLPELVPMAEEGKFNTIQAREYLKREFAQFELSDYGTVVLGCTHFIFFKKIFQEILPSHIDVIDGNKGTITNLKRILTEKNLLNDSGSSNIEYFISMEKIPDSEASKRMEGLFKILKH